MKKGKSRSRKARIDVMKSGARSIARKERAAASRERKSYDKQAYDKPASEV